MNIIKKTFLVCNDPVICFIYFYKLVKILMGILSKKGNNNPLGVHYVFIRFELQQRGSPHAHIMIWVFDDPGEKISENYKIH